MGLVVWYLLIFIGTFFEGEFTLVAAGFAVEAGYFRLTPIMIIAFFGAFLGDWCLFEIGRNKASYLLRHLPSLKDKGARVGRLLNRFPILTLFILRFQIGLRMVGNFSMGMGTLSRKRYLPLNLIACLLWSMVISEICIWFARIMVPLWSAILSG